MWHEWETGELYTGFWWADLRERDYFEDLRVDGKVILHGCSRSGMGTLGLQ